MDGDQGPRGRSGVARSARTRRAPAAAAVAEPVVEPEAVAAEVADVAEVVEPEVAEVTEVVEATEPEVAEPEGADLPEPEVAEPEVAAPALDESATTPVPLVPTWALSVRGLTKRFGTFTAVDDVDLDIAAGTFFGFVGPNGAGKTTTLSMITGLLRPDAGEVTVHGADVWRSAAVAKRALGILPDNLRLFDRLTGSEYLHHAGALRGLDRATVANRVEDLTEAFALRHSLDRLVSDYSAGMVKKISIAAAMIHSPRLLVLDEPFESVDPVSAASVIDILKRYAAAGGTVLLSSHSMSLIERTCDAVAIIADGRLLASGPMADVLDGASLEQRFVELAGGATAVEGMEWLQSYSD